MDKLLRANGVNTDLEIALFNADHDINLKTSLEKARTAYEARPSVTAADALAWTLYRAGRPDEALPYARELLRLGSHDPQVLFHAGAVALAGGGTGRGPGAARGRDRDHPRVLRALRPRGAAPARHHRRRDRLMRRPLLAILVGLLAVLVPATVALAHPLGNFSVNRYSRIEPAADGRPAACACGTSWTTPRSPPSRPCPRSTRTATAPSGRPRRPRSGQRSLAALLPRLTLRIDGAPIALRATSSDLRLLPGQAGLQTMRLSAWLDAPGAGALLAGRTGAARIDYRDGNDPERTGWREIVVRAPGLPGTDVSDELRTYPENLLQSPPDVRGIGFALSPAGRPPSWTAPGPPGPRRRGARRRLPRPRRRLALAVASSAADPAPTRSPP